MATVGNLAPIALFVYDRVDHTRHAIESLHRNPESLRSELFVFSDGARDVSKSEAVASVRRYIRAIVGFARVTVVERLENWGLASSVISGVSQLCESHGRVIVMEDDLVVSSGFLKYMNAGLELYKDSDRVMQIAGYMFDADLALPDDALFLSFISSWGWATWSRAWRHFDRSATGFGELTKDVLLRREFDLDGHYSYFRMLRAQQSGTLESWAILWYLSVFRQKGLALYPRKTFVYNTGFDGSGSNCKISDIDQGSLNEGFEVRRWPTVLAISSHQPDVLKSLPVSKFSLSAVIARARRAVFAR